MSEDTFLIKNHNVVEISSTANEVVYKKVDYGLGHLPSTRFFYFEKNKLVKVEENLQQPAISYSR